MFCPAGWKVPFGRNWQEVLDFIIARESPESYVTQVRKVPERLGPRKMPSREECGKSPPHEK